MNSTIIILQVRSAFRYLRHLSWCRQVAPRDSDPIDGRMSPAGRVPPPEMKVAQSSTAPQPPVDPQRMNAVLELGDPWADANAAESAAFWDVPSAASGGGGGGATGARGDDIGGGGAEERVTGDVMRMDDDNGGGGQGVTGDITVEGEDIGGGGAERGVTGGITRAGNDISGGGAGEGVIGDVTRDGDDYGGGVAERGVSREADDIDGGGESERVVGDIEPECLVEEEGGGWLVVEDVARGVSRDGSLPSRSSGWLPSIKRDPYELREVLQLAPEEVGTSSQRAYACALLILADLRAYAVCYRLLPVKTNYRLFNRKYEI